MVIEKESNLFGVEIAVEYFYFKLPLILLNVLEVMDSRFCKK